MNAPATAEASSAWSPRRVRLALGALLVLALALRLGYLHEQRRDVLFDHPVVDEAEYVAAARALVRGDPAAPHPYWQPPGIVYTTAAAMALAGPGLVAPRVVQAVVSTLACLMLFLVSRRLFGPGVALAAAAVLALHGVAIFASYELLAATWAMTLDLLAVWQLGCLAASDRHAVLRAGAAGLALGASAIFTPVVLPFALGVGVWLLWQRRGHRGRLLLVYGLGVALPIAPVAVRNARVSGELVLVSTNGGLNFYLGNNARSADTIALRPGRRYLDLIEEPRRAGIRTAAAESRYFYRKAGAWIAAEPGSALRGYARKLLLFVNGAEIPRDTDLHEAREGSRVLSALVWPGPLRWPDGVLIPFALVGLGTTLRRRRELRVMHGFLAAQALVVAAFFVTSRYRVPSLPLLALFAVVGARALALGLRRGPRRPAALGTLALVAGLVLCNLPLAETRASFRGELAFYRGLAYLRERKEAMPAVLQLRKATREAPSDARPWFELGNALEQTGQTAEAIRAWQRASELDPWNSIPARYVARAQAAQGDARAAIQTLEAHLGRRAHAPEHYGTDHLSLATLWIRLGEKDRARDSVRSAVEAARALVLSRLEAAVAGPGPTPEARVFWGLVAGALREQGEPAAAARAARLGPPELP